MIIWINGAFGAGKTTLSDLLLQRMPNARLFDPESLGYIIQKTFPEARPLDYQDLRMWRRLVAQFILDANVRFSPVLIVPMTLVVPAYLNEIFGEITGANIPLRHIFLKTSAATLQARISNQIIVESDPARDEEVRQWRLAQIDRCIAAAAGLPEDTIFLDSNKHSPEELVEEVLQTL